jgi:hypothetical protein
LRHIKCDETKPHCRNCRISNRVCDGIAQTSYTSVHEKPRGPRTYSPSVDDAESSLNAAAILPEAYDERRHFHFFQQKTALELSGYFDFDFFSRSVLQLSRQAPPIRHAVIALGALHEYMQTEDVVQEPGCRDALRNSGLRHYNEAISYLSKQPDEGKKTICITLSCCILFIWFETLQGNHVSRMQQLTSGLKILKEWQKGVIASRAPLCQGDKFIVKQLVPLFARLDLQGVSFEAGRRPHLLLHLRLKLGVPETFSEVEEARDWLDIMIYWLYQMVHKNDYSGPLPAPEGQPYIEQWGSALDSLLLHSRLTDANRRALTILKSYQKMATIMLATRFSTDEAAYDAFSPQFKIITSLAESLFNASENTGALDGFRYSFEMGVVAPLYYVSSKCQNQATRTKAVTLLLRCPRRGGVWDGLGMAKMASMARNTSDIFSPVASDWATRYMIAEASSVEESGPSSSIGLSSRRDSSVEYFNTTSLIDYSGPSEFASSASIAISPGQQSSLAFNPGGSIDLHRLSIDKHICERRKSSLSFATLLGMDGLQPHGQSGMDPTDEDQPSFDEDMEGIEWGTVF